MSVNRSQPLNKKMSAIRQVREAKGLTQQAFASQLNVSVSAIYQWEAGEKKPRLTLKQAQELEKILFSLGLTFSDLPDDWMGPIDKLSPMEKVAA